MSNLNDDIQIRISSLGSTRQLITFLAGGVIGLYAILGKLITSENSLLFCHLDLMMYSNLLVSLIVISFLGAIISSIMAIFLLTDSIHNYSKLPELMNDKLYVTNAEAGKFHNRAIYADDLSYFFVRIGVSFMISNILLLVCTVSHIYFKNDIFDNPYTYIVSIVIGFALIFYCYYVSHYTDNLKKNKIWKRFYKVLKRLYKYFAFYRWKEAAKDTKYSVNGSSK